MPPKLTQAEERLLAAYHEAALRLSRLLGDVKAISNPKQARNAVAGILADLESLSHRYITEDLPEQFKNGSTEAAKSLEKDLKIVDISFGPLHQEALQHLLDDTALKFASALEGMRRQSSILINNATRQKIVQQLVEGEVSGASSPAAQTKAILQEQGITALKSATRSWTLENYAEMLTRTVLAEAHNTGAMTRYLANGVQYGQVIEKPTTEDSVCRYMNGKVVFLGDRRLIPPYHPSCFGAIKPFNGIPADPIMSPEDPRIPGKVRSMLLKRV